MDGHLLVVDSFLEFFVDPKHLLDSMTNVGVVREPLVLLCGGMQMTTWKWQMKFSKVRKP